MTEEVPPALVMPSSETSPQAEDKKKKTMMLPHFQDKDDLFKTVCRTFMRKKKCLRANCKYVHDHQLCQFYWKTGTCKFGDECTMKHEVTQINGNDMEKEHDVVAAVGLLNMEEQDETKSTTKQTEKKKYKNGKNDKKLKNHKVKAQEIKAEKPDEEIGNDTDNQDKTKDKSDKKPKKKTSRNRRQVIKKNTESFEPMTKPVDLRITYDLGFKDEKFSTPLTTRDVVLVPNLFSDFKKGELYNKLVHELESCGIPREQLLKMWHGNNKIDGTHLIVDDHASWKAKCPTFDLVTNRLKSFFSLDIKSTRFNWYKDTSQWKPFHFDAAAVKPHVAAIQNFTVGISFGATRDAAFEHAETKTVVSIPQPDGCVYAFSKETNVLWRHGILQDVPVREEGRISVIAWGWVDNMMDIVSPAATVS